MAKKPKPQEEEGGGEGAPLWIISFADMISLLMAFFVMLSTFSSFGPNEEAKLTKIARTAVSPNFGLKGPLFRVPTGCDVENLKLRRPSSEKKSLNKAATEYPYIKAPSKDMKDIRNYKTFLIESRKIFWSSGTVLSTEGRNFLDTLSLFIKKQSNRVLISEKGRDNDNDIGISRSLVVLNYLTDRGVPKGSCNIGTKGMLSDKNFETERILEITLLDKNLYK